MKLRAFKYASPFIVYIGAFHAFSVTGWQVWLPLIYAWVIIPLVELFLKPNSRNMNQAEEELAKADKSYDVLLYLVVVLQYAALYKFLYAMSHDTMTWMDITGRIWVMGLLCGI